MAAAPTFWQVSTESEFLKGEVENLSIDTYGRLTLGPAATPLYESNAPFLWTLVTAADGTVYAGSGNEGQVFRITPAGKSSVFYDSTELDVRALLSDQGHTRDRAGAGQPGTAAGRHRITRSRVPDRRQRQALRPARLDLQRDPPAPRRCRRRHLRRGDPRA